MKPIHRFSFAILFALFLSHVAGVQAQYAGMVRIENKFHIDQKPIDVATWITYVSAMAEDTANSNPSSEFSAAMPDSVAFHNHYGYAFYPTAYNQKNQQTDLPMVGLSQQQMENFCAWRTREAVRLFGNAFSGHYALPDSEEYKMTLGAEEAAATPIFVGGITLPEATRHRGECFVKHTLRNIALEQINRQTVVTFRCVVRE